MFEKLVNLYIAYLYATLSSVPKPDLLKVAITAEVKSFDFSDQEKVNELLASISSLFGDDKVREFMETDISGAESITDDGPLFITPVNFKELRKHLSKASLNSSSLKFAHALGRHLEKWLMVDEMPEIAYDEISVMLDWTRGSRGVTLVISNDTLSVVIEDGETTTDNEYSINDVDDDFIFDHVISSVNNVTCGEIS